MNHISPSPTSASPKPGREVFTATAGDLRAACGQLRHVIEPRRRTTPILGSVRITPTGEGALLESANLEMAMSVSVDGACADGAPALLVPFETLHVCLAGLPAATQVTFGGIGEDAEIHVGGEDVMSVSCVSGPASDWPSEPCTGTSGHEFDLSAEQAHTLLRPAWAMAGEGEGDGRYYLSGLYLYAAEASLRSVATNGHRLALVDIDLPDGAGGLPGRILPRRAVMAWQAMLPRTESSTPVRIRAADKGVVITAGGGKLTTCWIDGAYPDYDKVVPKTSEDWAMMPRRRVIQAAQRAHRLCAPRNRSAQVAGRLTWRRHRVDITALHRMEAVHVSVGLPADCRGDLVDRTIGINLAYLRQAADAFTGDDLVISQVGGDGNPILLTAPSDPMRVVIMPMRV